MTIHRPRLLLICLALGLMVACGDDAEPASSSDATTSEDSQSAGDVLEPVDVSSDLTDSLDDDSSETVDPEDVLTSDVQSADDARM